MDKNSKILIVGHGDVIENALVAYLRKQGFFRVFFSDEIGLDTVIQPSVYRFFAEHKPEYVFLGSTRSGGIEANQRSGGEFIYHNLESQNNIVYSSHKFGVKKLVYFSGSCAYPKECPQPMKPEYLLTGPLEKTSEPYSVAKIAGIILCQAFRRQYGLKAVVAIPATIYGPGSDVNLETAHVMGALIGKFAKAVQADQEEVEIWGSGSPRREFLYADDFAEAAVFLMDRYDGEEIVHVGCGSDITIKELAQLIAQVTGYTGRINFDTSKPDGAMRKLLDHQLINRLGWKAKVSLQEGIKKTYQWYINGRKL